MISSLLSGMERRCPRKNQVDKVEISAALFSSQPPLDFTRQERLGSKRSVSMEQQHNSGESRSVGDDAMSIFGQSIDVRRSGKSRRRAVVMQHKKLVPEIERAAKSGVDRLDGRAAMEEKERAIAGARSHRPELQGARASSSRRKKGLVEVEAPGGARPQKISSTLYAELMQELERVKRELGELQHEVKVAREAKAKAERDAGTAAAASSVTGSASLIADGVERRDANDANEVHHVVELELTGAGRSAEEAARKTQIMALRRDTTTASRATESSDLEASWLTALSTTKNDNDDSSEATAITTTARQEGHGALSLQAAAEAELDSARVELESIKVEGLRFTTAMERTHKETARVTEEISRLEEQEKKASAQVQQLNSKLLKAKSRLEAVTAAGEEADGTLSKLKATLQQLEEETEAAEKEKTLTELENRCAVADMESIDAEIAAAKQRIRESFRELEAARASEASATEKLKAVIESARRASAAVTSQRSGNVTIPRFEYEYLTGRAEVVRAVADKKVAAAEAWVEARRAGEREMIRRAEAIERELGEAEVAAEVEVPNVDDQSAIEQQRPRDGPERAHPTKRPVRENGASRRKTTRTVPPSPLPPAARNPSRPSLCIKNRRRRILIPNYLKLISGKCTGGK